MKNISMTSKQIKICEEPLLEPATKKFPASVPQPSRFTRSQEYHNSETESDFECRSAPKWRPTDSDSEPQYRPVSFAPSNHAQSRMEMPRSQPKPMELTPNRQESTTYFKSITGQPVHNAIETTNSMQMHEHSENNRRVVNMQSTTKIINFNNQLYGEPEPFPYSAAHDFGNPPNKSRLAPPPTPTKFVKGEFRESDYESEIEASKIRPVWTPIPSDSEEPQYRRVNAPRTTRSASCPRSQQHPIPMSPIEFDKAAPYIPDSNQLNSFNSTHTIDRNVQSRRQHQQQQTTTTMRHVQSHVNDFTDQFKSKAQRFISDIEKGDNVDRPLAGGQTVVQRQPNEPQVYRDESRVSQYGE